MAADAELIFRSSVDGALTVDETTAAFDIGPTPLDGIPMRLTVPTDGGAADTLVVIFKTSATSGGTYVEEARYSAEETTDGVTLTLTAAGIYRKRIVLRRRYCKVTFDVTDGGGGVTFGSVDLRAETAGEYDNARRDL